jgi:hypothetical protein
MVKIKKSTKGDMQSKTTQEMVEYLEYLLDGIKTGQLVPIMSGAWKSGLRNGTFYKFEVTQAENTEVES